MIEGRLWYLNSNNNNGRGYGFSLESLKELQEKEGYNSFRFQFKLEDDPHLYLGLMLNKTLCGLCTLGKDK